jgi:S1-C subfamily serine protease
MIRTNRSIAGTVLFLALVTSWLGAFPSAAWAMDARSVFDRAKDSVVVVFTVDGQGKPGKFGSGFLLGQGTMVATNQHVIDGAEMLKVKLASGQIVDVEQVRAESREHDVAVLIIPPSGTGLALAQGDPEVGEDVLAIGHPKGLERSLSTGVVSGIRQRGNTRVYQITAPISPGSSGGPILNERGDVLGMATFFALDGQNLNFAVPVSYIQELLGMKTSQSGKRHIVPKTTITIEQNAGGILLKQK